jgi:hypothetical protein
MEKCPETDIEILNKESDEPCLVIKVKKFIVD